MSYRYYAIESIASKGEDLIKSYFIFSTRINEYFIVTSKEKGGTRRTIDRQWWSSAGECRNTIR